MMKNRKAVARNTVSLADYPDLVVAYLGGRIYRPRGVVSMIKVKRDIDKAVATQPDGLLRHEMVMFQPFPLHWGLRQYWRDPEALEQWTRGMPHQRWWRDFMRDPGGLGFWHETYLLRGGMESVYDFMSVPTGMLAFAENQPAVGALFSWRNRLGHGPARLAPVLSEEEVAEETGHADSTE
jgi:hypothetical protein